MCSVPCGLGFSIGRSATEFSEIDEVLSCLIYYTHTDPSDPPDDGAPAACVRWALAAGPGRADLGAAKAKSPDKVSIFTTMPRSVGVWLWIPPVTGCVLRLALESATRLPEPSQWLAGMVLALQGLNQCTST